MPYHTSSNAPGLAVCSASGTRDGIDSSFLAATKGTVVHVHMHQRVAYGVDEACRRLPDLVRNSGISEREGFFLIRALLAFEFSPPAGAFGEVALCLRENGEVVRVKGGQGKYENVPEDAVYCGTLDTMWSEPEPLDLTDPERPKCPPGSYLVVVDYKSGDSAHVQPTESNAQLAELTVMAAKWTGAKEAIPAIVFVRPGAGEWDQPETTWGARRLASAEAWTRDIEKKRRLAIAEVQAGRSPRYVEGPQCSFCRIRSTCPTKLAIVRAAVDDPEPYGIAPLTAKARVWGAKNLGALERFVATLRAALRESVDADGPVDLGDGTFWGPVEATKDRIDPVKAWPVLVDELGEEMALASTTISKSAIEDAIKILHAKQGIKRQVSPTMRRVLGKLHDENVNAIEKVDNTQYKVHRPAKELSNADVFGEIEGDEL